MAIAHETAHHMRRDPLWRTIAAITCTLHWCNPLGNLAVPIVLVLSSAALFSAVERKSGDWNPRVDALEIRTRLLANPFPGDDPE